MPNDTDPTQKTDTASNDNDDGNEIVGGGIQEQQSSNKNNDNKENDYTTRIAPWKSLLIGKKLVGARTRSQTHQDSVGSLAPKLF
jgi:hypothetical protein